MGGPIKRQTSPTPKMKGFSADLKAVVKDSKYKDSQGLPVQTKIKQSDSGCTLKSPKLRPLQLSKSVNGLVKVGMKGKHDTSTDIKESTTILVQLHDAARYYDSKDESYFSMSREAPKLSYNGRQINCKVNDFSRLHLDRRESPGRSSVVDPKPGYLSENLNRVGDCYNETVIDLVQSSSNQPQASREIHSGSVKTLSFQVNDPYMEPLKVSDPCQPIRNVKSPQKSRKELTSPRGKNNDTLLKPSSSSKFPIEPAPWKHMDYCQNFKKHASRQANLSAKDVEFKQSKGIKAIKQIPEIEQAKGITEAAKHRSSSLENRREDDHSLVSHVNARMYSNGSPSGKASDSTTHESLVLMKPARVVQKSVIPASSILQVDDFTSLQKIEFGKFGQCRKNLALCKSIEDQSVRDGCGDQATTANRNFRVASLRIPKVKKEDNTSSFKNLGTIAPRRQHTKMGFEKRSSCTSASLSDLNNTKKQPDWLSTTSKTSNNGHHNNVKLSKEVGTLVCPDNYVASKSTADMGCFMSEEMKNDIELWFSKKDAGENHAIADEQPSPVSVLESSVYMEDSPSPIKQASHSLKGNVISESNDKLQSTILELPSKMTQKKLHSINFLVQKLRQLNPRHDESQTDYIGSLCGNSTPDVRYISEILVVSGILLRAFSSGLNTLQLQPSGNLINPELFFVLEHINSSKLLFEIENNAGVARKKSKREKLHRKLIFDVVNEILAQKLNLVAPQNEPLFNSNKLVKKNLAAEMLLEDLCAEIELFGAKKLDFDMDEEQNVLENILLEDVMHRSDKWMDLQGEVSRIVLDVERFIFKELINEIICLRVKPNRPRRQLFGN